MGQVLRCPKCADAGRAGVLAVVRMDGVVSITNRGRRYEFEPGAVLARCWCDVCKEWIEPQKSPATIRVNVGVICLTQGT